MTRLSLALAAAALCAVASGCNAPDITALQNDKNADCVTLSSVYENFKFDRNWGCEYPPPGMMLTPAVPASSAAK